MTAVKKLFIQLSTFTCILYITTIPERTDYQKKVVSKFPQSITRVCIIFEMINNSIDVQELIAYSENFSSCF